MASMCVFFKIDSFVDHPVLGLFLLSMCRLWNGLHGSVFAGEGLGTFKISFNRFLLLDCLPAVSSFSSTISLSFFLFMGP